MALARKAVPSLTFNGANVDTVLKDYLKKVSFTDVASDESDSVEITLQNIEMKWLDSWYPAKGDRIAGSISFKNWDAAGASTKRSYGTYILDEISFRGGPLEATFKGVSIPSNESFKTRKRTKTWMQVTIQQMASEIASRYSLSLAYNAGSYTINSLEQSEKTDSEFLYDTVKTYGLKMKVYNKKIVIYDPAILEAKSAVATIRRRNFIDDGWEFVDTLEGTYTGARISYKSANDSEEISIYVGKKAENSSGSRVLYINNQCDSLAEAQIQAKAQVNLANEEMTTISGPIWPDAKIVSGITVTVKDMGQANGKYFVDKVTTEVSTSGTTQKVEMHKCQTRI